MGGYFGGITFSLTSRIYRILSHFSSMPSNFEFSSIDINLPKDSALTKKRWFSPINHCVIKVRPPGSQSRKVKQICHELKTKLNVVLQL